VTSFLVVSILIALAVCLAVRTRARRKRQANFDVQKNKNNHTSSAVTKEELASKLTISNWEPQELASLGNDNLNVEKRKITSQLQVTPAGFSAANLPKILSANLAKRQDGSTVQADLTRGDGNTQEPNSISGFGVENPTNRNANRLNLNK
jgi:hypothetical protein